MPKAQGARTELSNSGVTKLDTKEAAAKELGFDRMQSIQLNTRVYIVIIYITPKTTTDKIKKPISYSLTGFYRLLDAVRTGPEPFVLDGFCWC